MKRSIFWLLCTLLAHSQQLHVTGAGAIDGTVKGQDGTLISGADVTLHRVPGQSLAKQEEKDDWSVTSDVQGSFSFTEVGNGLYRLCARANAGDWLDPCDWGLPITATSLSLSEAPASVTVVMRKGAPLPVRIDDPGQSLLQVGAPVKGTYLLLGVTSETSFFHTLPILSADSAGRNYQITVPFDTKVNLVIITSLQIADSTGLPLVKGATTLIPVTVPSGSQARPLKFAITGVGAAP